MRQRWVNGTRKEKEEENEEERPHKSQTAVH